MTYGAIVWKKVCGPSSSFEYYKPDRNVFDPGGSGVLGRKDPDMAFLTIAEMFVPFYDMESRRQGCGIQYSYGCW
jgi:hypothetical protein